MPEPQLIVDGEERRYDSIPSVQSLAPRTLFQHRDELYLKGDTGGFAYSLAHGTYRDLTDHAVAAEYGIFNGSPGQN